MPTTPDPPSKVVPKPPAWAAKDANTAWAVLKRPDGKPYTVFQSTAYVNFINWVRGQRDHLEALRMGVFGPDGVKPHLDRVDDREQAHFAAQKLVNAELRAAVQNPPFPG